VHVIGVYHTLAQDAKARQSSLTTMARQAVTSADALLQLVSFLFLIESLRLLPPTPVWGRAQGEG
jgi:hypothetical protein